MNTITKNQAKDLAVIYGAYLEAPAGSNDQVVWARLLKQSQTVTGIYLASPDHLDLVIDKAYGEAA